MNSTTIRMSTAKVIEMASDISRSQRGIGMNSASSTATTAIASAISPRTRLSLTRTSQTGVPAGRCIFMPLLIVGLSAISNG